jgi:20S proteasome alpha/beta subunit
MATIIVGFKCVDGVVIASDSQSEFGRGVDVKRLNANKIYVLDENRYIVAGSGTVAHIRVLAESIQGFLIQQRLQQRSELTKDEAEAVIERALWALVRHYNVDRSNALNLPERGYYQPIAVFAGSNRNIFNNAIEYYVDIVHGTDGTIEPISDYGAAGSGAAYAELLLKSLYDENIRVDEALKVAVYVIGEVKAIDPHCGGDTQVAVLCANTILAPTQGPSNAATIQIAKVRRLTKAEIEATENDAKAKLDLIRTKLVKKVLRGEIDEDKIRNLTRDT